jgi:hypothetical protein
VDLLNDVYRGLPWHGAKEEVCGEEVVYTKMMF